MQCMKLYSLEPLLIFEWYSNNRQTLTNWYLFDFTAGLCETMPDSCNYLLPYSIEICPKNAAHIFERVGWGASWPEFWWILGVQPCDQFNTSSIFAVSRVTIVWSLCALSIALWQKTSPNEQTMCVNFDLNCLQIDNAEKRTNEGNHFFML